MGEYSLGLAEREAGAFPSSSLRDLSHLRALKKTTLFSSFSFACFQTHLILIINNSKWAHKNSCHTPFLDFKSSFHAFFPGAEM